jgi:hypothetical protein
MKHTYRPPILVTKRETETKDRQTEGIHVGWSGGIPTTSCRETHTGF